MVDALIMLAAGWLLLIPPIKKDSNNLFFEVDTTRPLSEWRQHSAFDTAKECEAKKEYLRTNYFEYAIRQKQSQETKSKGEQNKNASESNDKKVSEKQPTGGFVDDLGLLDESSTKETSEERWKAFDKAIHELKRQSELDASMLASISGRCLPTDVLFPSSPKK